MDTSGQLQELKSIRNKAILAVCTLGVFSNLFLPLKKSSGKITRIFGDGHLAQGMIGFLYIFGIPILILISLFKNIKILVNCQSEINKLEK